MAASAQVLKTMDSVFFCFKRNGFQDIHFSFVVGDELNFKSMVVDDFLTNKGMIINLPSVKLQCTFKFLN